jgi:zinc protease
MKRVLFLLCWCANADAATATPPSLVALPANDHPTVSLAIQFKTGALDDPDGKAGLTYLTAHVMALGGTEKLSAKELLEAQFPMAAEIHVRVDKELTTFSTTVHKDHLAAMVAMLTDVVAHPRWDEKEFARLRDDAVNDVAKRLRQGDDENLGKEALGELMYAHHPYGRLSLGHAHDLAAITLAEVKAHAQRVFTLDRMTLGVAGGYPKELPQELAAALASLPAKSAPRAAAQSGASRTSRVRIVEKETQATAISLGFPYALSRRDPDFVAMTIARSAFGEHRQFNGRLMQRLREQRGLNYGDYAYIEHFEQAGHDAATAQTGRARHQQDFTLWLRPVQNDNALFALRAALHELSRTLGAEPFSEAEVEATKGFLDGYVLLFAQTDERKLGYALDDKQLGVDDFLGEWRRKLPSVTAAEVNAAWRKWIDPARLSIVLVAPRAAEVRRMIVSGAPKPIHYRDESPRSKEQLAADGEIAKQPYGVSDVEIVAVGKMFE